MAVHTSSEAVPRPAVHEGVAVIGIGNWGSSLVAGLRKAHVPVCETVHARQRRGPRNDQRGGIALNSARLDARVLWLTVPDAAIPSVAEGIVRMRGGALRGQLLVHSSGALSSSVLEAAGAVTAASVHPMMSFPTRKPVSVAGVPFAVESAHAGARRRLFALVRKLGGRPFVLPAEGKALYHAAGTFASPLLTSLLAIAVAALREAGLSRTEAERLLHPMARRTVENVFRQGAEHSFSGPMARGDSGTIDLHLRALAAHPLWQEAYRSLAEAALASLPSHNAAEIRNHLARS